MAAFDGIVTFDVPSGYNSSNIARMPSISYCCRFVVKTRERQIRQFQIKKYKEETL